MLKNGTKCLQVKEEATLKMSPLPRLLAYQWNALTNLYGMLGGENLGVMDTNRYDFLCAHCVGVGSMVV